LSRHPGNTKKESNSLLTEPSISSSSLFGATTFSIMTLGIKDNQQPNVTLHSRLLDPFVSYKENQAL